MQGLIVLLIICLFSFSPFSPPKEVGKRFLPEFALKSFLILCAFSLDIEIIFSCLIQLLLRSCVSCRKWDCFAVSFGRCCILTVNPRVRLSCVRSVSCKFTTQVEEKKDSGVQDHFRILSRERGSDPQPRQSWGEGWREPR